MHCIASSLCFWIWTILRETMDSFNRHSHDKVPKKDEGEDRIPTTSFEKSTPGQPIAQALTAYNKLGAQELIRFFNGSATPRIGSMCVEDSRMNYIYQNFSPYLYPFTVEYSILVGMLIRQVSLSKF